MDKYRLYSLRCTYHGGNDFGDQIVILEGIYQNALTGGRIYKIFETVNAEGAHQTFDAILSAVPDELPY